MVLAESPQFIDPREVPKSYETTLELTFGGEALAIGTDFILWAQVHQENDQPFRSMLLYVTTDEKVFIQKENSLAGAWNFRPNTISVLPLRISHNPKRNTFYIGTDYEINYQGATGSSTDLKGSLVIRLASNKSIQEPEVVSPEVEFVQELRRIRRVRQNVLR